MKRALVAGAAGFLGSHFVDALIERGYCVRGVDNFSTGNRRNLHHLENLSHDKWANCYNRDIADGYMTTASYDVIINAACPASPPAYQADPVQTMKTCFNGTLNLLDVARNGGKFIHCATSEAYGDPEISPQSEAYRGNVNTTGIRACYDEGKRISETLCAEYNRLYKIPVKIVRIFNTYGPRMDPDDGRVVTNFIKQALKGEKFTLYGGGHQTRSFCYVSDLVDGFMKVIDTSDDFIGPMNLGNRNEFTVRELAQKINEKIRPGSKFEDWCIDLPLPEDDPKQRKPDISLARKTMSWEPKVQLSEGLDKTIDYIKSRLF